MDTLTTPFANSADFATYTALREQLISNRRAQFVGGGADLSLATVLRAQCRHFCDAIAAQMSVFTLQSGFISGWPESVGTNHGTEHWWLIYAPTGEIVDPTAEQFPAGEQFYTTFDPNEHEVRLGRCFMCGDEIYGLVNSRQSSVICSDDCALAADRERHC